MKVVKQTDEYTIYEKRNGRMAVKGADKKWITAEEKVRILVEEKLLTIKLPEPKAEEPAEEEATEEAAAEESPAEESPAE